MSKNNSRLSLAYPALRHYRLEILDPKRRLCFEHVEEVETLAAKAFRLARQIDEELDPVTILESGEIRIYSQGRLAPFGEERIRARIEELERDSNTIQLANLVLHHVKSKSYRSLLELNQSTKYINVKNGVVDIETGELIQHNKNLATLEQFSNIVFNPNAHCPNLLKALKTVQPDPAIRYRILKSFALCFDKTPMKRQIDLWIGENDTGKSTLLRVLGHMLGQENTAHENLQALAGEDPYARAQIFQKAANICADLERIEIKEAGKLKELAGGDTIRARFIYQRPFDFPPYQKFLFSCNKPPYVDPELYADAAFWERFRITFFRRQFSQEEIVHSPKLVDESDPESGLLTRQEEISGLFNILLGILRKVRQGGDYGYRFNPKETRETWLSQIDYVQRWINEEVIIDPEKFVEKTIVRNSFNAWRLSSKIEDPGDYDFNSHLSKIAESTVRKFKTAKGRESRKVWNGINLKSLLGQNTLEMTTMTTATGMTTMTTAETHYSPNVVRRNDIERGGGLGQASVVNVVFPDSLRAWFSNPLRYNLPRCQVCGHEYPTTSALAVHLKVVDNHNHS